MILKCSQKLESIKKYQVQYCTCIKCAMNSSIYMYVSVCVYTLHGDNKGQKIRKSKGASGFYPLVQSFINREEASLIL